MFSLQQYMEGVISAVALPENIGLQSFCMPGMECYADVAQERRDFLALSRWLHAHASDRVATALNWYVRGVRTRMTNQLHGALLRLSLGDDGVLQLLNNAEVASALDTVAAQCVKLHVLTMVVQLPVHLIRYEAVAPAFTRVVGNSTRG